MKEKIIPYLVFIIAVAGCTFLINLISKGKNTNGIDEIIKAKDETIQAVIRERDSYRAAKDELIQIYREQDSTLNLLFEKNQETYKPIYVNLSEIPKRINRIAGNDDSIRAAFANQ